MKTKSEMTISSGNVFEDLGLPNAAELDTKVRLGKVLIDAISECGLSQREVAKVLGIPQSNVSLLVNYKLEGFSIERLMHLLLRMNRTVTIEVGSGTLVENGNIDVDAAEAIPNLREGFIGVACHSVSPKKSPVRFAASIYAAALNLTEAHSCFALPRLS